MDPPRESTAGRGGHADAGRRAPPVVVRILLAAALVAAGGALVTARLFVWPPSASPASVNAVVVLSGDHGERVERALALINAGVSTTFVHVGDPDTPQATALCTQPQRFEVVCLGPQPDSTRSEAEAIGRLARQRGWTNIGVVTSTQHVARAGLLIRRCVDGRVQMVVAKPAFGWRLTAQLIVEEWAKLAYSVTVQRQC